MQDVLTELIKVQQNYHSLQPEMISAPKPITPAWSGRSLPPPTSYRSLPNNFNPIPETNRTLDEYDVPYSVRPSHYPSFGSPGQIYTQIQNTIRTPQTRLNTLELGYQSPVPFSIASPTSYRPSAPKIGYQNRNMIRSKEKMVTQSFQEISTITPTPNNTPRLSPKLSEPEISVARSILFRNIDSNSISEQTTPEKKSERGTAASISILKTGNLLRPASASDVRVNEHYKHLHAHRYRRDKAVSPCAFIN